LNDPPTERVIVSYRMPVTSTGRLRRL